MPTGLTGSVAIVYPKSNVVYKVSCKDSLGCIGTATVLVRVSSCINMGLTEEESAQKVLVYPNPCKELCRVDPLNFQAQLYELVDVFGRSMLSGTPGSSGVIEINLAEIPTGMYFLKLKNAASEKLIKILRQ